MRETSAVRRQISKSEAERLFVEAVDGSLPDGDALQWQHDLESDVALKSKFEKYGAAVALLKKAPKEKAPEAMASLILRRTRKRRVKNNSQQILNAWNVGAEVLIPILVAILVAAFLVFSNP
jgi:anti-sigma factor RsiW